MTYHKLLPLLLLALLLGPFTTHAATDCNAVTEISKVECESLLELYHSTNGSNWINNDGWNTTNTPCSWYGLTCGNGGVVEIDLGDYPSNNLNGTIPDFSGLPNLQELWLSNNQLTGSIPNFSGLSNLQKLTLYRNQLTGSIPDFSGLPNLQELWLSNNQLTGPIPDFSGLPNLQELWLSNNQLTGSIPNFSGLSNLQELWLSNNQLTGSIPNFSGLSNLQKLTLSENQLTGNIPDFSGLSNLQKLTLSENQLTGNIPDFSGLSNLRELDLSENQLTWNRTNFNGLSNLQVLNLSLNQLTGTFPDFFKELPNLRLLDLSQNQLTDSICHIVSEISKLECESLLELYHSTDGPNWTSHNGWNVTNTPCSWYGVSCRNGSVIGIDLNNFDPVLYDYLTIPVKSNLNNLVGNIPDFSSLPNLQKLDLSYNQLTGPIPNFSGLPNLEEFSVSRNQLTGSLPDFSGLSNLERLDFYDNQLTGTIPDFSGLPNLQMLSLSLNQLTGSLPDFSGLPNLTELSLSGNQLAGTIPDFSGLSNLYRLYLENNQLTGTIPDFSGLPNLSRLGFGNNQLTGTIPDFSELPKLGELDLKNNQLTGTIPDFSGLPNLRELGLENNQLTGTIPEFSGVLLNELYLNHNQLTGSIPDFSGLPLSRLFLNNNQLTGSIPDLSYLSFPAFDLSNNPFDFNPGQAIIIAGPLADDTLFKYSNKFAQWMYRLLVKRGYKDDNIHYLNVGAPDIEPFDGHLEPERQDYALLEPAQELATAFAHATAHLTAGEQLLLYFHGHAQPDHIYLGDYELSALQLRDLLATVPAGVQQIIILDSCYAGSFLDELAGVANRIVITSTDADTSTFPVITGSFTNDFFLGLEYGENLIGAFRSAERQSLNRSELFAGQRPWLDDDGDGQFLNDGQVTGIDIGKRIQYSSPPSFDIKSRFKITLPNNVGSENLWIRTMPSQEFIHQVQAVLVKPSSQPIEYRGKETDFSHIELPLVYNPVLERYEVVYNGFCAESGIWKIYYHAQNTDGVWSQIKHSEIQAQNCTAPVIAQMSLNQSRYTTGEALRVDMTVDGNAQVDLYAAIVFPDGTFITIADPLSFSWPNAVQVYQPSVQITEKKFYSIMDFPLPGGIALGNYSACGVLLPAGHDNPIDATQWIHYHCIGFEVY